MVCQIEVATDAGYVNLLDDVNPTLFQNADLDSRVGAWTNADDATDRIFSRVRVRLRRR